MADEPASSGRSEARLHTERVTASPSPRRWLYVVHGIYGAGRNWRTVASRLAERRSDWGVLLVDLRHHGESPALPPPHTVESCARDVVRLSSQTELPPAAILGHSYGGKVALVALEELSEAGDDPGECQQAWIVDSPPGASEAGGDAVEMLGVVRRHPGPFENRDEAVRALDGEGIPQPVARWMAINLERDEEDAYRWRLDWDVMSLLLESFFATDAWAVVESPPTGWEIHLVRATRSDALSQEAVGRIREALASGEPVRLHEVEGGHWLNADNPDAMVELLAEELPG